MLGACRHRSSGRRKRGAAPLRAEVGAAEETCCRVLPQLLTGVLPDFGEELLALVFDSLAGSRRCRMAVCLTGWDAAYRQDAYKHRD